METTTRVYPLPGTKASRILAFIRDNPGASRNKIISGLEFNPAVVRKAVGALMDHGLIDDEPTALGHHRYSIRENM